MDLKGIETIAANSNVINTWCLSIIAATLLAILSTGYLKPVQKGWKLIYLLFIPGWIFLALAIHSNGIISGRAIRAALNPENIPSIIDKLNDDFANQLNYFNYSIFILSAWLILYLIWWIFHDFNTKKTY
jgi:hypothetical protein